MFLRRALKAGYQTKILINNNWVNSISGETFATINPATEEVIAHVQRGTSLDIDKAVEAAHTAFHSTWRSTRPSERSQLLNNLADLMEKHKDELSYLESLDAGKPIINCIGFEIPSAISTLRYNANYTDKIFGKTIPMNGPFKAYTRYEAVGVAGQIIPWNVPLIMAVWKIAPAIAAGCTIVLKPSEKASLTTLRLGELIVQAGFPPGVVNIVPGLGDAGARLTVHPKVSKVAFTGSLKTGTQVLQNAGVNGLKKITLELGGKSPNVIMDDADLDYAIGQSQMGVFYNQGQACLSGSRVFVHEKIYDEFVERTVSCASKRKIGDPLDPSTEHGPQIDELQMNKVLGYIESGKQEGAKLLLGGKRWGKRGYFIEPTVFSDVKDDMKIAREEIFGPVFCVFKFKDLDEVIKRSNDTQFGLAGGIITKNMDAAFKYVNAVRTGVVYVNHYLSMDQGTPFGGFKQSGIGRELGKDAILNYLESKTVIIKTENGTLP